MSDFVVVGRVGKAHGIKGEVSVEPRTDEPDRRFVVGARLAVESIEPRNGAPSGPSAARPSHLTVAARRWHQGRLLVRFEEVADRTAAEAARGIVLAVEVDPDAVPADPEEFYDHQLIGCACFVHPDGARIGTLIEIHHHGAQDLLVIETDHKQQVLVPFVAALVPVVDPAARRLEIVDRPGLLDPEALE